MTNPERRCCTPRDSTSALPLLPSDCHLPRDASAFAEGHRMTRGTFDLIEPATGETLARVPRATADEAGIAVERSYRAFTSVPWRSMNPLHRGRALQRLS